MQSFHLSSSKTLCRFCGEEVTTNNLSTHIAQRHPRPVRRDMKPILVRAKVPAKTAAQ